MNSPCLCAAAIIGLHQAGDERAWWEGQRVNVLEIARGLWEKTHPDNDPIYTNAGWNFLMGKNLNPRFNTKKG